MLTQKEEKRKKKKKQPTKLLCSGKHFFCLGLQQTLVVLTHVEAMDEPKPEQNQN